MQLDALRREPHISVNQIKTYLACPRKYVLQYVDRVEPAFRNVALAFGSAFHETFGFWLMQLQEDKTVAGEELHDHFFDALRRELTSPGPPVMFDDDEDEETLVTRGHRMLDVLVGEIPRPDRVIAVEQPFRVELVDPSTGEVLEPPLVGAVDGIVERAGREVAIELKTGARRWGEENLLYDLQITAYQHVLRASGHRSIDVELVLVTKRDNPEVQIERLVRTREDEAEFIAVGASVLRAVTAGVDHPVRSWRCKSCPFLEAC